MRSRPARRATPPSKAGTCEVPEGGAVLHYQRVQKADCAAELGCSFRAGQRAGAVSGQIVTVVGCSRSYESDEDNEDMGDMQGGGWGKTVWVRLATPEESEPVLADEAVAAKVRAAKEARKAALTELLDLPGEHPRGETSFSLVGEEIPLRASDRRIYGGGVWAVIEPARERVADPSALAAAREEYDARVAALKAAQAALIAWTADHLSAEAPQRKANNGRVPYDGRVYGTDLALFSPDERAEYDQLDAEIKRLSHTSSPDSYHVARARLETLEQQALLATYPRSVWIVKNNGHDGDDWRQNNVRTDGAGGVGKRLPWSEELEALVRAAKEPEGAS